MNRSASTVRLKSKSQNRASFTIVISVLYNSPMYYCYGVLEPRRGYSLLRVRFTYCAQLRAVWALHIAPWLRSNSSSTTQASISTLINITESELKTKRNKIIHSPHITKGSSNKPRKGHTAFKLAQNLSW